MTQSTKVSYGVILAYTVPTTLVNFVYNNGDTMLIIKNDSVAPITVTFDSLVFCNQDEDHDIVVTIANATEKAIGMFNPKRFNNSSAEIKFTLSAFTDVSFASVEVLT